MKSLQLKPVPHLQSSPLSQPSSSSSFLVPSSSLPLFSSSSSSFIAPLCVHPSVRTSSPKPNSSVVHAEGGKTDQRRPDSDANVVLRLAWYGAEALGNVVAALNPKGADAAAEAYPADVGAGPLARENVVEAIKNDYEKAYFVTGNVTTGIYQEDCEFADPAGSFRSLKRFKNNCSNFGSLLEKSDVKLTRSQEFEDKFVAYWRFSCVIKFPWRPILSSTGYTEYYFDLDSGKVCRHAENWDVPKMALLGQVFKPNPSLGKKGT